MKKEIVMSGIQPTGEIHIGNYLGALRQWVELTNTHQCFYVIVDYHAITIDYDPILLRKHIIDAAFVNVALGMEPGRCFLVRQSQIPEIMELNWIFASCAMVGRLTNMTQFKDKSSQHEANINAGLLTYPILQAADILIYKSSLVPIGEDQYQHLELAREIARKFNARFGDTFPEPRALATKPVRLLGLDGEKKMSKSIGNYIGLLDNKDLLWKKLGPAKTDIQRVRRSDPGRPWLCNIFSYHQFFTPDEIRNQCSDECQRAAIGCIDCKKILYTHLFNVLEPIQQKYHDLKQKPGFIIDFLNESAKEAGKVAKETIMEVREKMGML